MGPESAHIICQLLRRESEHENARQQEELLSHASVLVDELEAFRHLL